MTTAIIVLLILAAIAAVFREYVWMDRVKEINWKHNDRVKSLENEANDLASENLDLAQENEQLEAAGREAVTALREAALVVGNARVEVEAASG